MKKILTVVGARPQFIKAATVSRVFENKYSSKIEEIIVHTGQHYDGNMSAIFFSEMKIPTPSYHLNITGSRHGSMTGDMLAKLEEIMLKTKPDIVLVYGDTNSTLAAALAAAKLNIPVAHVEAGLRSFNRRMPEEINRIMTDHLSSFLFAPTENAKNQLDKEGIENNVFVVGDVMHDATIFYQKLSKPSQLIENLPKQFCLATVHRQENTDCRDNLHEILSALTILTKKIPVILPLHPRTKKQINEFKLPTTNITILEPVGYFDMLELLKRSQFVLTDSGGLQKEAYYFSKPVIVMREETEWTELVLAKAAYLSGANAQRIAKTVDLLLEKNTTLPAKNIYGDGASAEKVAAHLSIEIQ